jgi:hypothetical protein
MVASLGRNERAKRVFKQYVTLFCPFFVFKTCTNFFPI